MRDLRKQLRERRPLIGTLITLDSPEAAVILRNAGFQWFFLDLEHSPLLDLKTTQRMIEVLQPHAFTIVRVPDNTETCIKHALDTGCDGIIVPHVGDQNQARLANSAAKYPPHGTRSVGITRAHGYGDYFQDYLENATDKIAVIAQIEEVAGVENIDAILSVDGIDAAFVGPYDLSGSLGIPGRLSDPRLVAMIDRVRDACAAHDKPFGIFCPDAASARDEIKSDTTLIAVGSDTGHLRAGGKTLLESLQVSGVG